MAGDQRNARSAGSSKCRIRCDERTSPRRAAAAGARCAPTTAHRASDPRHDPRWWAGAVVAAARSSRSRPRCACSQRNRPLRTEARVDEHLACGRDDVLPDVDLTVIGRHEHLRAQGAPSRGRRLPVGRGELRVVVRHESVFMGHAVGSVVVGVDEALAAGPPRKFQR